MYLRKMIHMNSDYQIFLEFKDSGDYMEFFPQTEVVLKHISGIIP